MIFVSRYSNKELKNGKYMAVRISVGTPKWELGYNILGEVKELMPFGLMGEDKETFKTRYFQRLESFGVERIKEKLESLEKVADELGKDVVLLCYEDIRKGDDNWCHRTMFAEWWEEKTGVKVPELNDPSEVKIKVKQFEEISLF